MKLPMIMIMTTTTTMKLVLSPVSTQFINIFAEKYELTRLSTYVCMML